MTRTVDRDICVRTIHVRMGFGRPAGLAVEPVEASALVGSAPNATAVIRSRIEARFGPQSAKAPSTSQHRREQVAGYDEEGGEPSPGESSLRQSVRGGCWILGAAEGADMP